MSDAPPPPPPPAAGGGKTNGLAIASLIMGILALICVGPLAGIPGVICGHMALGRIKLSGQGGRGMAIAGLVMGYIGIIGFIIFMLLGGLAVIFGSAEMVEMTPPSM